MNIIEIIILGIIQGIGEFLPISSSAHLILFRDVLGVGSNLNSNFNLVLDVALHFGTALAIMIFFFKDLLNIGIKGLTTGIKTLEGRLMYLIIVATIPAAIIGVLFEEQIDLLFRNNHVLIALSLIIVGIIIYLLDKKMLSIKNIEKINFLDSIIIGLSQCLALIPGFSRSGTTIAASRALKIDRESAAKFSFYLSLPIVLGALLITIIKDNNLDLIINNLSIFIIGIITSFITGIISIKFLLTYLKSHDFKLFMWYRIILALIMLILIIF